MAVLCSHTKENKHQHDAYMLNQNIVEEDAKARLVVRGCEEVSEKGLVSAEQFAVQSFDLEALRNHPKIRALMNNARVREIQKDMQ